MTTITVTAEDIDKAHAFLDAQVKADDAPPQMKFLGWACDCPIAYAIKRALPNHHAFVTSGLIQWRPADRCVTKSMHPDWSTREFIVRWDTFKDATPGFTFTLQDHNGQT